MHCDLFNIYCAPLNLGITRTLIFRLNFAQSPIFSELSSLKSLKSQTRDPQLKVPPGGLVLRIFTSWKNSSTSAGFEPANLGSRGEHVNPESTEVDFGYMLADCYGLTLFLRDYPCLFFLKASNLNVSGIFFQKASFPYLMSIYSYNFENILKVDRFSTFLKYPYFIQFHVNCSFLQQLAFY